ncbi:STAS domain-containing protein [Nonomuraea sp. NPDC002799]
MDVVSVDVSHDGTLRVVLRGEIDFTNSVGVHETIRAAMAEHRPKVVRMDLVGVTFMDSTGIGVLVNAMRLAAAGEADFRVENPTGRVRDQLRTTGLLAAFGLA